MDGDAHKEAEEVKVEIPAAPADEPPKVEEPPKEEEPPKADEPSATATD